MSHKKKVVLILGGAGFDIRKAQSLANQKGLDLQHANIQRLRHVIRDGEEVWKIARINLADVNAIWVRGLFTSNTQRNDARQVELIHQFFIYIQSHYPRIKVFDRRAFYRGALDKHEQIRMLTDRRILVPETHIALTVNQGKYLPLPGVVKPFFSCDGRGIELLQNRDTYREWSKSTRAYFPALIQKWIPNDGDVRILIIGGRVLACVKRVRQDGFLNNPTRNVVQEHIDLPSRVVKMACRAVKVVGLDIAGVDLIQDQDTQRWHILEVNQSPDLQRIALAGISDPIESVITFIAKTIGSR